MHRAEAGELGDPGPEMVELHARALAAAALDEALGEHRGVERAGAGAADALDPQPLLLQQTVEDAPGEGAVAAAALQSEVDRLYSGDGFDAGSRHVLDLGLPLLPVLRL